jgi:signal transduction histidine kinase
MRFGLRLRLLLPLMVLLIGILGASGWSARVAAGRAEERVARQIHDVAKTLAKASYPLTKSILEQIRSYSGAEFLLVKPDGSRLGTFRETEIDLPHDSDAVSDDRLGPVVSVAGQDYHCRVVPLKDPNPLAGARVTIFYPRSLLQEAIDDAVRPSLFGLVFSLLAVVLTLGIGQRLVGRIRGVERRTRQIAGGNFEPGASVSQNDEIGDLSRSVDDMALQLAKLQEANRQAERTLLTNQIAAGLAHQLRNGITGAKLALQLHSEEGEDEALQVALRQLRFMEANLRRFIDLSRPASQRYEPFFLNGLVDELLDLYRPRCLHEGVALEWHPFPVDRTLVGDPDLFRDLVTNLLGNAIEAAGPGGRVRVVGVANLSEDALEFHDSGPGPAADIAGRLFEPFVTSKPEGIGLGLAVARSAAQALGGDLSWQRRGSETVFRVAFPNVAGDSNSVKSAE